jgi:TPR repeat protein
LRLETKKFWILLLSAMITVVRLPGVAFSAIVALWLGFAAPVAAGYDEGAAAFIRGDYEEAWQEWRDLGERGHQSAQYNLGVLYSIGLGVEQDDGEASKWFRRAADRGLPAAQMRLGNAYMEGKGVTEDLKEAYFWFTLAATHFSLGEQHEQAVAARESTGAGLTRAQITAVLERAMSWKPLPQAVDESEKERLIAEPTGESSLAADGGSSNGLGSGAPSPTEKQSEVAETETGDGTGESGERETQVAAAGAQAAELTDSSGESSGSSSGTGALETGTLETNAAETNAAETSAAESSAAESGAAQTSAEEAAQPQPAAAQNGAAAAQDAMASGSEPSVEAAAEEVKVELATATGGSEAQETSDSPDRPAGPSFAAHLSSVRSEDGTETEWRTLQGQYPALLDDRELAVSSVEVADEGTFYRVMAGTFDSFDEAEALCGQLQANHQYCVVRRLSDSPSQD